MKQHIGYNALLVKDYDEAITYYTRTLGFVLIEDTPLDDGKRWVLVAARDSQATRLLLARAVNPQQRTRIGNQTAGPVFLFLHTDEFWTHYHDLKLRGVHFTKEPWNEGYFRGALLLSRGCGQECPRSRTFPQ